MPEKSYLNGTNDGLDDIEELETLADEFDELDDAPRAEKKSSFFSRMMPNMGKNTNHEKSAKGRGDKKESQNSATPKSAKTEVKAVIKHHAAGSSYTGHSSSAKAQTQKQKPVHKAVKKPAHIISDRALKAILTILLIASACFAATGIAIRITANSNKEPEKKIVSVPGEQTAPEIVGKEGGSITGLYATVVVPGTRAVIGEGAVLHFNSDGATFTGFFDKDNPSIKGTYTVTAPSAGTGKDIKAIVTVQNGEGRRVSYNLEADGDDGFILVYPGSKIKMKLLEEGGTI